MARFNEVHRGSEYRMFVACGCMWCIDVHRSFDSTLEESFSNEQLCMEGGDVGVCFQSKLLDVVHRRTSLSECFLSLEVDSSKLRKDRHVFLRFQHI